MKDAGLYARIRRLFFAEHWKVGTIASELGIHHDTVKRAIEADRFAQTARPVRPSLLDPYKGFVGDVLDKHPRLRSTRLFEMVRERGYPGSVVQLRRYVATIRPTRRAEAYLRVSTLPGEQAQVDWGHFGKVTIGRASRSLSCFVLVLGYSRALFARFALDQKLETFLFGHVLAFEALGGVPRECLYDNLKSVVLEREGEHIRFHPQILELAGHYHFAPKPCAPYRGNEKGKVERTIQYLRHSFFAARRFSSVADLNEQLAEWTERVAHARPVPGDPDRRPVADALAEERKRLLPLPEHRFETDLVKPVASGKTPYIRFDLNDYSIPHDQVRIPLTLIASETEVRFADATGAVVAHHARSFDRGKVIEDPEHLAELAREKRRGRELRGRDRLRSVCENAAAFIDALAQRGEPLAAHTARLCRLLDHYGADELDRALADAFARGAVSAASVAHVLDQRARARRVPPPLDVVLPDDPRVRDLRVTPHALAPYDALAHHDDDPEDQSGNSR
jgi:transposase